MYTFMMHIKASKNKSWQTKAHGAKNGFYIYKGCKTTTTTIKKMGRDPQRLKYLLYLPQKMSDLEKKHETLLGRACNWELHFVHSILQNYFFAFCFTKRSNYFLWATFIFNLKNESIQESDFKKSIKWNHGHMRQWPWAKVFVWVRSLSRTK